MSGPASEQTAPSEPASEQTAPSEPASGRTAPSERIAPREPASEPSTPSGPDPMKGIRGVFAAVLVLEAIVVLLALLVFARFGSGPAPVGVAVIVGLALLMIVGSGLQRRPWGLGLALSLQAATIVAGFVLVTPLGVVGVVFALVWAGLLLMRRDVARKMARGELPSQQSSVT